MQYVELTEKTEVDWEEEQAGKYQTMAAAEQTEVGDTNTVVDLETVNKEAGSDCLDWAALHLVGLQRPRLGMSIRP